MRRGRVFTKVFPSRHGSKSKHTCQRNQRAIVSETIPKVEKSGLESHFESNKLTTMHFFNVGDPT